jgi:hypothetical protein
MLISVEMLGCEFSIFGNVIGTNTTGVELAAVYMSSSNNWVKGLG